MKLICTTTIHLCTVSYESVFEVLDIVSCVYKISIFQDFNELDIVNFASCFLKIHNLFTIRAHIGQRMEN